MVWVGTDGSVGMGNGSCRIFFLPCLFCELFLTKKKSSARPERTNGWKLKLVCWWSIKFRNHDPLFRSLKMNNVIDKAQRR